jgi:aldose sugar dehydrogenase
VSILRSSKAGWIAPAVIVCATVVAATIAAAQQRVPFQGGIPIAPAGLKKRALPDKPVDYDTAEGQNIRVSVVARGIPYPFGLAFLPDGTILVTERLGRLRAIRKGTLDPQPVAGTPANYGAGESGLPGAVHGLMDVVPHPQFTQNNFIYLNYTKPLDATRRTLAVARGRWDGRALTDVRDVFVADPGNEKARIGTTSRMAFGRDNLLFVATSGADPQDPNTHGGKVLRLRDDGTVPADNPFVGRAGHKPEVYTLGHRSTLGLAMHPVTGEMWQNENGPNGGDEINILKPGANYGWPRVSYGRTYPGPWQVERPRHEGFEPPVVFWMPSIAASGMAFYTGDRLPKWKGDVFVGSLRTGEIPGTGHLERVLFNEKMEELRRETLLTDLRQRIRDVRQGADGLLYLVTDEKDGAVIRIEPAP